MKLYVVSDTDPYSHKWNVIIAPNKFRALELWAIQQDVTIQEIHEHTFTWTRTWTNFESHETWYISEYEIIEGVL